MYLRSRLAASFLKNHFSSFRTWVRFSTQAAEPSLCLLRKVNRMGQKVYSTALKDFSSQFFGYKEKSFTNFDDRFEIYTPKLVFTETFIFVRSPAAKFAFCPSADLSHAGNPIHRRGAARWVTLRVPGKPPCAGIVGQSPGTRRLAF